MIHLDEGFFFPLLSFFLLNLKTQMMKSLVKKDLFCSGFLDILHFCYSSAAANKVEFALLCNLDHSVKVVSHFELRYFTFEDTKRKNYFIISVTLLSLHFIPFLLKFYTGVYVIFFLFIQVRNPPRLPVKSFLWLLF